MVGTVISIRVCRDAVTRRSLGYAYVNYLNSQDGEFVHEGALLRLRISCDLSRPTRLTASLTADRALESLNYSLIKNKPCRIMWSQRDPSQRRTGAGNVFIKNLDESIDNKALHDTFAEFGAVVSCKVALDESGKSRGYGFVHYETTEAADKAIAEVNNMMLADKVVYVGHYVPKRERQAKIDDAKSKFTNLYVKNLSLDTTEEELKTLFEKHGTVTSAVIQPQTFTIDGKELKFGFVNFEDHDAAKNALNSLHESTFKDETLFVTRAQKKGEREEELRKSYDAQKFEKTLKYQGVNLYVKNLDDDMDEEKVTAEFQVYGTISSCKIMRDEKGVSRGFGFVCFSSPDEATKAVNELNGKMIGSKPLYVSLAQRKDVRKQQLEAQLSQRNQIRNQQLAAAGIPQAPYGAMPGAAPMYYGQPGAYPPQGGRGGPIMYPQAGAGNMRMPQMQRYPGPMQGMPPMGAYGPMGGYPGYPQNMQGGPGGRNGPMGRGGPMGGMPAVNGRGQQMNGVMPPVQNGLPGQRLPGAPNGPGGINARPPPAGAGARGQAGNYRQAGAQQQQAQQAAPSSGLTAASLANASPAEQKQMLGETIYPKIHATQPELAGKITGMLLEMDNAELLVLLEDDPALEAKVQEALAVLYEYKRPSGEGAEAEQQ